LQLLCQKKAGTIQKANQEISAFVGSDDGVRVVRGGDCRAAEFSWVLLEPLAGVNANVTFVKVAEIMRHTGGDGERYAVLHGHLHNSRAAPGSAAASIHLFIGMPVLDSRPDSNYIKILPGGYMVCVHCQQSVLSKMSILTMLKQPGKLVCLARQPADVFSAVSAPVPAWRVVLLRSKYT
jgi:hypothetical protein